jgi:hypothetical protein
MRWKLYLSALAAASLLGSTLIASAQGPANSADSTETIPGPPCRPIPARLLEVTCPVAQCPQKSAPGAPRAPALASQISRSPRIRQRLRLAQVQRQAVPQKAVDSKKADKTPRPKTAATDDIHSISTELDSENARAAHGLATHNQIVNPPGIGRTPLEQRAKKSPS